VGRVVVDVMLKPEILDPQGQAVAGALPRLGFDGFTDVRQGKRFELEVPGAVTPEVLDQVRQAAATLLSNPVIEDVVSVREARLDDTEDTKATEGTEGTEGMA
jgi:phosphoribosylformylglycinamidine synthase PurS subunit